MCSCGRRGASCSRAGGTTCSLCQRRSRRTSARSCRSVPCTPLRSLRTWRRWPRTAHKWVARLSARCTLSMVRNRLPLPHLQSSLRRGTAQAHPRTAAAWAVPWRSFDMLGKCRASRLRCTARNISGRTARMQRIAAAAHSRQRKSRRRSSAGEAACEAACAWPCAIVARRSEFFRHPRTPQPRVCAAFPF